jgi:epoxyqueuosine reductase QueG
MLSSKQIKKIAAKLGADLCGIASSERFNGAPDGYHPKDIYNDAKSVIAFAKRFPVSTLSSNSLAPYTVFSDIVRDEVSKIALQLSYIIEDSNSVGIPIPSSPYTYYDEVKKEGRGTLSFRHAGYLAGLGFLGKNTLLVNKKYGNMITLGVVITNLELESDPLADYNFCRDSCSLCLQNCPGKALDGTTVNQKLCREHSEYKNGKGNIFYSCSRCRAVCPYKTGIL